MKYDATDIHLRYDQGRKLPEETIALWLDSLFKFVPADNIQTLVDLGCGTGRFLNALSRRFSVIVHGVDPSIKMLTKARGTVASPMLTFTQSSAENLCLGDETVDLVFLSQTYHHFQNKIRALSEIRRVVKTGGFLCIRNSTIENLDTCFYLKFFPRAYEDDHDLLSSRDDMTKILHDSHFDIIKNAIIRQKFAENMKDYYQKIACRSVSDLEQLPDSEFEEGLKALRSYCMKNDAGEPVVEEMDLFICRKAR
jgi:ubiquinone/menaquinone biosynthesis C-methylase UbiE